MGKFVGKLRPQIMVAILGLLVLGLYALRIGSEPVVVGSVTGIVALAKDVLASDND